MPRLADDVEEGTFGARSKYNLKKAAIIGAVAIVGLVGLTAIVKSFGGDNFPSEPLCPVPAYFSANSTAITNRSKQFLSDKEFIAQSVEKLSKAVQVPTEVYDSQPDVDDAPEVWAKFGKFHHYLEETFPTVYANLDVDKINTWGLVFTWKGKNTDLKPVLLAAHQDVVPVQKETIKNWKYDPFSGHIGKKYLFGRGALDCKNLLVGLMETVEQLLADDFKPQRSIVLAFGFDEEASGEQGARYISEFLLKRYGRDSFYAVIDEGDAGLVKAGGGSQFYAQVATGEKGHVNAHIELTTPGGHSSVPPDHTSIGIMSSLLKLLEDEPFEAALVEENPTLGYMQCLAEHDPSMPKKLKTSIFRAILSKAANSKVVDYLSKSIADRYLVRTSQAIDIIQGGAKSNALPEHVSVISNYRINIGSSVNETLVHVTEKINRIAKEYDVGFYQEGEEIRKDEHGNGHFSLSVVEPLEPAPASPTDKDSKVWMTYGGALRHFYENVLGVDGKVIVTPGILTGNTDTKCYWGLTKNIYRYVPALSDLGTIESGIHSVNEKIEKENHIHIIAFYYEYLQAIDKVTDEE
ncbi:hypothetical protein BABINDRAFT_160304 [Babjeviella inositovora NRRL Y-12698]|uniref:Peptidase M20 dimerisation domain-containing protein n=1 Tax=Babjeviella inositovora NRRL Y-12698 TaxID=984486 RepID=A0A1E3QWP9_9ASCO|nr:uncharacterized protein BABINDRAFT_160304 [Babjeviella inositovora NRRL Y-12698]ODQ82119.1 hypothetical protein BABINDRAFT_160304 [Babjeviella inositovora NRRL Y-12698]